MSFFSHNDIDLDRLKEWFGHIQDEVKRVVKSLRYPPGTVVEPSDMTVLESDDYSDFAVRQFTASGRIEITILSPGCLLLVLTATGSNLRVMCLESGQLGRIDASSVVEYR